MDSTAFSHKLGQFQIFHYAFLGLMLSREISYKFNSCINIFINFSRLNPLLIKQGYIPTSFACLINDESVFPINVICATPKLANFLLHHVSVQRTVHHLLNPIEPEEVLQEQKGFFNSYFSKTFYYTDQTFSPV